MVVLLLAQLTYLTKTYYRQIIDNLPQNSPIHPAFILVLLGGLIGGMVGLAGGRFMVSKKQKEVIQQLLYLKDGRSIGPTLEVLVYQGMWLWKREQRALAIQGLIQILPVMQPVDADELTFQQRNIWLVAIKRINDKDFAEASLKGLRNFGTSRDKNLILTVKFKYTELRSLADECLTKLSLNEMAKTQRQQLLRASMPGSTQDNLLRPAGHVKTNETNRQLRPISGE